MQILGNFTSGFNISYRKMLMLKQSMELGGQCHMNRLNPEFNYLPVGGWEVAHDTGRWWDAMLQLEAIV
ncbi:MAG: hypothetical protein GWP14_02120 [Actinobacteria bacterium]|nr:hypothetical protein [Actinomycetota bacterium]